MVVITMMRIRGATTLLRRFFSALALLINLSAATAPGSLGAAPLFSPENNRSRLILEAYRRSFPDRVTEIRWQDGDWTIRLGDQLFYWARGRILPPNLKDRWEDYKPYAFYTYRSSVPDPEAYSAARIAELRRIGDADARKNGGDSHGDFRAALYGGSTRREVEQNLVKTSLFGRSLTVHRRIREAVGRVDRAVKALSLQDAAAAAFIREIGSLGGYNWRDIRGTQRISYHSWGLAIDVTPKKLGSKSIFWEWERNRNPDWMLVPAARRWGPPEAVVRAFEREGFIWGGTWDLYDGMHFEYRPELLEINRVAAAVGGLMPIWSVPAETPAATDEPGVGGGD